MPFDIKVHFIADDREETSDVDPGVSTEVLLGAYIQQHKLDRNVHWSIHDQELATTLDPKKTLEQNGVQDGHHLHLRRPDDAAERAEAERKLREREEQERREGERAEAERLARENAEEERKARDKAEMDRLARERAEAERKATEKAKGERKARENPERVQPLDSDSRTKPRRAVFISYRRDDSEGEAGRLYSDLARKFGDASVFMDVAGIEPGLDFRKVIDQSVASCAVLLAVIGPHWLDAKDESGRRRLDNPNDLVRLETAAALRRDIPVIPVLVRNATVPTPEELPADLKDLAYRNGSQLTHARWDSDVFVLIRVVERHLSEAPAVPTNVTTEPEHHEAARLAREKAEEERKAREKAEQDRLARERAEAERKAAELAEAQREAREKAAREQRMKEEAQRQEGQKARRFGIVAALFLLAIVGALAAYVFWPRTVAVPDLRNQTLTAASTELTALHLKVGNMTYQPDSANIDIIVDQIPSPNTQVKSGSSVNLTLSSGPSTPPPPSLGELIIGSNVAGATAEIGETHQTCGTPCRISLPPGGYTLSVSRDNYQTWSSHVDVIAKALIRFNASLIPLSPPPPAQTGTLIVIAPPNFEVYIDNNLVGRGAPNGISRTLSVGDHQCQVRLLTMKGLVLTKKALGPLPEVTAHVMPNTTLTCTYTTLGKSSWTCR
jgi:hypothetical protein